MSQREKKARKKKFPIIRLFALFEFFFWALFTIFHALNQGHEPSASTI